MLLSRLLRANTAYSRESGSTLVPVVILTAIGLLITALLGNLIITSYDFTAKSKAHIQAEIAAEAGLLVARAEIAKCYQGSPTFDITQQNPNFTVQIRSYTATGTTGSAACPGVGDSIFRVVSTGYSTLPAGLFSSTPYSIQMEQAIDYIVDGPIAGGPAGFFGGGTSLPRAPIPYSETGTAPLVFSGSFACDEEIKNDVVMLKGTLTAKAGCIIRGNVWWAEAAPVISGGQIIGQIYQIGAIGSPAAPVPTNQKWLVVGYDNQAWLDAGFDQVVKVPSGTLSCNLPSLDEASLSPLNRYISTMTQDTLFDGFAGPGCGPSGISGDINITITKNVVIYAKKFTLQRLKIRSGDAKKHKVWIVVPDEVGNDQVPPCGGNDATEKISIKDFDVDIEKIAVMLYTPGLLELAIPRVADPPDKSFRGQIIACGFREGTQFPNFYFDPMGIPKFNLDTGERVTGGLYPRIQLLKYKRDLIR